MGPARLSSFTANRHSKSFQWSTKTSIRDLDHGKHGWVASAGKLNQQSKGCSHPNKAQKDQTKLGVTQLPTKSEHSLKVDKK